MANAMGHAEANGNCASPTAQARAMAMPPTSGVEDGRQDGKVQAQLAVPSKKCP